jgi:hypothetical protein
MGYRLSIQPMAPGLDPLYTYGFNYAAANGLTWGRDFISSCGPYGYVMLTMDVGGLLERTIIFNLVLVGATALAIAAYLLSIARLGARARIVLAIVLAYAVSLQGSEYRWFVLFLLVLLTGIHLHGRMSLVAFSFAGILAGSHVLVKFSLGLNAVTTLLVACFLVQRLGAAATRLAVAVPGAAGTLLIGWGTYQGGLTGLAAYLTTGSGGWLFSGNELRPGALVDWYGKLPPMVRARHYLGRGATRPRQPPDSRDIGSSALQRPEAFNRPRGCPRHDSHDVWSLCHRSKFLRIGSDSEQLEISAPAARGPGGAAPARDFCADRPRWG